MADFGLSKRIEETSKSTDRIGVIPYIDPKRFDDSKSNKSNKESDIYSLGVLFWELSIGHPPFQNRDYNLLLISDISNGLREKIVEETPEEYSKLYTGNYNIYIVFFIVSIKILTIYVMIS